MNGGGRRRRVLGFLVATAVLIAGPILLYKIRPIAGLTAAFGSGAIALVVLEHLGVLAVVLTPFLAWQRRRRSDRRK